MLRSHPVFFFWKPCTKAGKEMPTPPVSPFLSVSTLSSDRTAQPWTGYHKNHLPESNSNKPEARREEKLHCETVKGWWWSLRSYMHSWLVLVWSVSNLTTACMSSYFSRLTIKGKWFLWRSHHGVLGWMRKEGAPQSGPECGSRMATPLAQRKEMGRPPTC